MLLALPEIRPEFTRLDRYLTIWAAWMRAKGYNLAHPKQASPGRYRARIQNFEDLAEEMDGNAVHTVDALVCSLPEQEECSVHVYHLGAVWRFYGLPLDEIYLEARTRLVRGLDKWGLV